MNAAYLNGYSAAAPLDWSARWIWHRPLEWMDNFHLLARRVFTLSAVGKAVVCHLSCNSLYELWVNGFPVGRGPNPSFPGYLYFDSHDITSLVCDGENVIAVHVYNFGPTMQSTLGQNPGPGGLIVQLELDGHPALVTDEQWRVIQDPSRQQRTDSISGHRGGFKEVCDGRSVLRNWQSLHFNDATWQPAFLLGPASARPWGVPIPREIPPLRIRSVSPVNAFFHTCGNTYGGKQYDVARPEALLVDDQTCTVVQPLLSEFAPSLLLDFGRGVYGRFEIEIEEGGMAGGVIELSYGESLHLTVVDRYVLRPGEQSYAPFERRGGRYLQLTFRCVTTPVRIRRVVCHEQSYTVEPRGHFACSDALVNQIWRVGRDTSRANMHDHFEDAPWREQSLYTGDVLHSARIAYYVWGDEALARKCLRQFARLQNDQGLIPLFGPAPKTHFVLPEYPALWVTSVWDHYQYWGDDDFLKELWPAVQRCLDWYAARSDADGLFVRTEHEVWGVFIDNLSNLTATNDLAAEQMLYGQGLRSAARIAGALGHVGQSDELLRRAERLTRAIEYRYWSEEHQCLVDSRSPGDDGVTQITNGLGLLLDVVRPSRRAALESVLFQRIKAPPVRAGNMAHAMVEALLHRGHAQEALDRLREYWGGMLDHGATAYWEVFDPESPDDTVPQRLWSLSHAFCAGPAYALPACFAGVRPLTPGFGTIRIQPKMADFSWLKASIPTPKGDVQVRCFAAGGRGGVRLIECELPAGMDADILLDTGARDLWSLWIDEIEVPLRRDGSSSSVDALRAVNAQLTSAKLVASGINLYFTAAKEPLKVRFELRPKIGRMGRRIIVAEPGDNWDAAPKPVITALP